MIALVVIIALFSAANIAVATKRANINAAVVEEYERENIPFRTNLHRPSPLSSPTDYMELLRKYKLNLNLNIDSNKKAAPHPQPTGKPKTLDDLTEFITALMDCYEIPGLTIAMLDNGNEVYSHQFGVADVKTNEPVTANTLFPIGSTTKQITAEAALRVGIDPTARTNHATMWEADAGAKLRLSDMLSHQTGLPRHDYAWALANQHFTAGNYSSVTDLFPHLENAYEFRTRYNYNNLMWASAGQLIEERIGTTTWEEYLAEEIFAPLGMNATFPTAAAAFASGLPVAHVHGYINGQTIQYRNDVNVRLIDPIGPAGSGYSTASSMLHWLRYNCETPSTAHVGHMTLGPDGLVLSPPTYPITYEMHDYTFGWITENYRGHRVRFHNGGVIGGTAEVVFFPDAKKGIAIYMNCDSNPGGALFNPAMLIRWYASDVLLSLPPWLDASSACVFPCSFMPALCEEIDRQEREQTAKKSSTKQSKAKVAPPTGSSVVVEEYTSQGYGTMQWTTTDDGNHTPISFVLYDLIGQVSFLSETDEYIYYTSSNALPNWADECAQPGVCIGMLFIRSLKATGNTVIQMLFEPSYDIWIDFTLDE